MTSKRFSIGLGFAVSGICLAARASASAGDGAVSVAALSLPRPARILHTMQRVNDHFMAEWPDPGAPIVTDRTRPSNIWTRGVYYEGLMALYAVHPDPRFTDYAVRWGEAHRWSLRTGLRTRNADDQCCGQTYLELYLLQPDPRRINAIRQNADNMVQSQARDDWWWIDAVQMALPVFSKLGLVAHDPRYWSKGRDLFLATRDGAGRIPPLFNPADGLWWRDKTFVPPHRTPAGKNRYWSRGNGWVMAAMVRSLEVLPDGATGRPEYLAMLRSMAQAVKPLQRPDGFWNPSLVDPADFGGPETSGTALIAYGLAAGIRLGVLDLPTYGPVVAKAWAAVETAIHSDGFVGFVQGTGKQPADGQPVSYDHRPDFDDYGAGCVLLAGSEVYRLAQRQAPGGT